MEKTFKERLVEIMEGMANDPFSKKCDVSEGSIRHYLKGGYPGRKNLVKIAQACKVSVGWLASGEGEKYLSRAGEITGGIVPGNDQTKARLIEARQKATVRNSNLRLLVEWMDKEGDNNEVDFAFLFYEDTRVRYPSFEKFIREKLSNKAGGVISEKKIRRPILRLIVGGLKVLT